MNIYTGIVYLFACLCLLLPHLDDDTLLYMTVILLCVHEFMALVIYGAVHLEYLWNGGVPLVQSVKRSVESRQRTSAEVAEYEQQMAQTTEYMRKLQLEYQVL